MRKSALEMQMDNTDEKDSMGPLDINLSVNLGQANQTISTETKFKEDPSTFANSDRNMPAMSASGYNRPKSSQKSVQKYLQTIAPKIRIQDESVGTSGLHNSRDDHLIVG